MDPSFEIQQDPFSGIYPATIPATASIVPRTQLSFISGTTPISSIVPPIDAPHILSFVFTNIAPGGFTTGGNIAAVYSAVQNKLAVLQYDSRNKRYYPPGAVDATVFDAPLYLKTADPAYPNAQVLGDLPEGVLRVTPLTGQIISVPGGAILQFSATQFAPADNQIYYFGNSNADPSISLGQYFVVSPISGILTRANLVAIINGNLGGAQPVILRVRNITTGNEVDITLTAQWDNIVVVSQNNSLLLPVTAGDRISLKIETPAWPFPNPTQVNVSGSAWIEVLG